mgnify:CR=1 FL=1
MLKAVSDTGNHSDSDKQDSCNVHNRMQTQSANAKWLPVDMSYVTLRSGPKKGASNPLESFLLFFGDEAIELIVRETNKYAEQTISSQTWKPCSQVYSWIVVDKNEICVCLALSCS